MSARLLGLVIGIAVAAPSAAARPASCPSSEQLAERVIGATVTVLADGQNGIQGSGSGFFIAGGFVATNWHVVAGSKALRLKFSDQDEPVATKGIVAADLANDLAIIALDGTAQETAKARALALELALPKRGARIYAFGSPRLLEATMSDGIVSAEREIDGAQRLQITAAVSPGSSGGPVTDECGDVVGIAYMKVKDSENLNFAIPAHFLSELTAAIAAPRAADVMEREGQDRLKSVVATRLGVPQGVDPAQWVQIDPVTQRFFVGLERKELAGPDFFRHVGEGARLGRADNTLPTLLYVSAGACAAASLCACAVSVPLLVTGVGFITAPIGGLGLCASAGLGAGGFLMWSDAIAPELSFDEAKKLAEAHNRRLIVAATADAKRGAAGKRRGDAKSTPTTPPVDDAPPGDPPPPPLETPTPPVDRSAPKEQLAMPF